MSSSWSTFWKHSKKYKKRTPSPTLQKKLFNSASRVEKKLSKDSAKKTSVLISWKKGVVNAGMTVEAAILIPTVMFFFLHIMSSVEMMRFHGKLCFALWECGNQLTLYTAMPGELEEHVPDIAISYLYVRNRVKGFLGKDYMDTSPVVGGTKGLNYISSSYEEDCVDIGVTYQVKPKLTLFSFPYMRMVNRYYGRAWTGYNVNEKLQYVYVTLYGEAWHSNAECTHIFITVLETNERSIRWKRNLTGQKYSLCELCGDKQQTGVVYYTEQGNRYHHIKECSSLTRYISAVPWQENMPYSPCSRCVGKESMK